MGTAAIAWVRITSEGVMRRSAQVFAPILASLAVALLSGCHRTEPERCVDEQNQVVDPKFCANLPPGDTRNAADLSSHDSRPPYSGQHHYRHYYGGLGGFALGSMVSGGSYTPIPGHSYSYSSGTSRGGFGRSFSSSSGHGGGGGE